MLKNLGLFLIYLLLVFSVSGLWVYVETERAFNRVYEISMADLPLPKDDSALTEGRRLYLSRGCVDCHGNNLAGREIVRNFAAGVLAGSNITRGEGGLAPDFSTRDFVAAIRHGLNHERKPLRFMPSQDYTKMSDQELATLIAYINSVEAVDRHMPFKFGPMVRLMLYMRKMPIAAEVINHKRARPETFTPEVSVAFGKYLAQTCVGCHGETFSGGQVPGTPPHFKPAANLTPDIETGLGKWTEADFTRAMRKGKRPDGSAIDEFMPWQAMRHMTDTELKALWIYFKSIPARSYGNR